MNNQKLHICFLATSFPRSLDDEASVFLGRLIDAYSEIGIRGEVIVPHDRAETMEDQRGNFAIHRFRYGLFSAGRLAFGSGILPNLRRNRLLSLQVPLFLLQFFFTAFILEDN